jgi:iron complex outermembrane receptor protein
VRFFTNAFETTTQGIDLVATWALDWGGAGSGDLTAAWGWSETDVDKIGKEVSRNRVHDLENENPQNRGIFTYNHFIGGWRLMARASYYGEWADGSFSSDPSFVIPQVGGEDTDALFVPTYTQDCVGVPIIFAGQPAIDYNDECYGEQWIFDIEAAYTFNDMWSVIAGIQNVADEFGELDKANADGGIGLGSKYETVSPFGFDGGFWYFRVRAEFD